MQFLPELRHSIDDDFSRQLSNIGKWALLRTRSTFPDLMISVYAKAILSFWLPCLVCKTIVFGQTGPVSRASAKRTANSVDNTLIHWRVSASFRIGVGRVLLANMLLLTEGLSFTMMFERSVPEKDGYESVDLQSGRFL